jgi:signal transduction histidine kinase
VWDTGRGIDATAKAKIFDDFYTTKADGTGLGLSIVRRLVMDLEGSMRVESEVGKGSRFIVDLPAAETARKLES